MKKITHTTNNKMSLIREDVYENTTVAKLEEAISFKNQFNSYSVETTELKNLDINFQAILDEDISLNSFVLTYLSDEYVESANFDYIVEQQEEKFTKEILASYVVRIERIFEISSVENNYYLILEKK